MEGERERSEYEMGNAGRMWLRVDAGKRLRTHVAFHSVFSVDSFVAEKVATCFLCCDCSCNAPTCICLWAGQAVR